MTEHTTDKEILANISRLVEEERKLYAKGDFSDAERDRLKKIGVELDQCWDLLRQRRGLREFGRDADKAEVRPAKVVENYKG
jgi:calcineurin-like phosphoesterase family protein